MCVCVRVWLCVCVCVWACARVLSRTRYSRPAAAEIHQQSKGLYFLKQRLYFRNYYRRWCDLFALDGEVQTRIQLNFGLYFDWEILAQASPRGGVQSSFKFVRYLFEKFWPRRPHVGGWYFVYRVHSNLYDICCWLGPETPYPPNSLVFQTKFVSTGKCEKWNPNPSILKTHFFTF